MEDVLPTNVEQPKFFMTEKVRSVDIPRNLTRENVLFNNGFRVLITHDCPEDIATAIKTKTEAGGVEWFQSYRQSKEVTPSNRDIYFVNLIEDSYLPVAIKKKRPRTNDWPKTRFYTTSMTHEIATTEATRKVLEAKFFGPIQIELVDSNDKPYLQDASLSIQKPYGAIIDTENQHQRYGIFDYVSGDSVRNKIHYYGLWNDTPRQIRKLAGSVQVLMDNVALELLNNGIEPWDLGAHQVIYREDDSILHLTILDTEEYGFGYGKRFDIDTYTGLYPVLLLSYIGM